MIYLSRFIPFCSYFLKGQDKKRHCKVNAFKGIKIGVGILIFRVALTMLKKMKTKPLPRIIAGCAFAIMLAVNFLSLRFSSITLMLIAGSVSLGIFLFRQQKGGARV